MYLSRLKEATTSMLMEEATKILGRPLTHYEILEFYNTNEEKVSRYAEQALRNTKRYIRLYLQDKK